MCWLIEAKCHVQSQSLIVSGTAAFSFDNFGKSKTSTQGRGSIVFLSFSPPCLERLWNAYHCSSPIWGNLNLYSYPTNERCVKASSEQSNVKKTTEVLNNTINHLDLIDRYRILHPKSPEYKLFSSTQGTFSRTDQILGHQTYLNKFKRTEIISSIFFDHNGMKLEINHKQKNGKRTNIWRLNNMLLKHQWVNNKIKEEIRKYLKTN